MRLHRKAHAQAALEPEPEPLLHLFAKKPCKLIWSAHTHFYCSTFL